MSADLQRLASLSDCVFAVAMTLLTFSIRIPDHGEFDANRIVRSFDVGLCVQKRTH
jgi:uncharacterized membrane protein